MEKFLKKIAYYDGPIFLKKSLGFAGLKSLLDEFEPEGSGTDDRVQAESTEPGVDSTVVQIPEVSVEEPSKPQSRKMSAAEAEKFIVKKLSEAKVFLSRAASSVTTMQSKKSDGANSLWDYLLSPQGQKEFDLMKSLTNCGGELGSLKLTGSLKRYDQWIVNMRSYLTRSVEKMSSIMGNAIGILINKENAAEGEEKLKFASLKSDLIKKIEESKKFSELPIEIVESSTAVPGETSRQKQNLFEIFKRDVLLNISNIPAIKDLVQARIAQIEIQDISEDMKEKLFQAMKDFVFGIVGKIAKFNQDLEEAFETPEKIEAAKASIMADITSSGLSADIKARVAEQISIIFKRKMDELRRTRGFASQTLQRDLKSQFPDITQGVILKD